MEDTIIWQEDGLNEIGDRLAAMFPGMNLSFEGLMGQLLQGDIGGVVKTISEAALNGIAGETGSLKELVVSVLILGIVSAALVHFTDLFDRYHAGEVSFYFVYLLQSALLIRCFTEMMETAKAAVDNIVVFVKLLMPAYFLITGIATGSLTAGAGYQMILFLIYGVEELTGSFLLPLLTAGMLLNVLQGLQDRMEALLKLLLKVVNLGMRGALGVVAGINLLQAILLPALDGIKGSAFQRIVSSIPGIGNGAENVIELALGSAAVLKNSVGILLLLFLVLLCFPPLFKLFCASLLLKATAAMMGIVSDRRLTGEVDRSGDILWTLLKTLGTAMLLFFIAIAMTAATVRR